MDAKEYVPYGEEWKDELMKLPKIQIIAFLRAARLEITNRDLKSKEDAKEYLRKYSPTMHKWLHEPDAIAGMFEMIAEAMESYHQAKSKEEAEKRYGLAKKHWDVWLPVKTKDKLNEECMELAAFGKEGEG